MVTAGVETAIRQTLYRYCRGVDRCDRELILSCFVPGCPVDYVGIHEGTAETFTDFVLASHGKLRAHSHLIGNVLVEDDGHDGQVRSEAYGSIVLWKPTVAGASEVVIRNRYLDRWEEHGGSWRIADRVHLVDLRTIDGRPDEGTLQANGARS